MNKIYTAFELYNFSVRNYYVSHPSLYSITRTSKKERKRRFAFATEFNSHTHRRKMDDQLGWASISNICLPAQNASCGTTERDLFFFACIGFIGPMSRLYVPPFKFLIIASVCRRNNRRRRRRHHHHHLRVTSIVDRRDIVRRTWRFSVLSSYKCVKCHDRSYLPTFSRDLWILIFRAKSIFQTSGILFGLLASFNRGVNIVARD